jgi:hypothetical protein
MMTNNSFPLAARFKCHPEVLRFLQYCEGLEYQDATRLGQHDVQRRLDAVDLVALQLLTEVLYEMRTWYEKEHRYREAAYWDLVADRIEDEIVSR